VVRGVTAGVTYAALWAARTRCDTARALAISVSMVALLSPITWTHHLVALVVPLSWLIGDLVTEPARRMRWATLLVLGLLLTNWPLRSVELDAPGWLSLLLEPIGLYAAGLCWMLSLGQCKRRTTPIPTPAVPAPPTGNGPATAAAIRPTPGPRGARAATTTAHVRL
jgi:hypothetical protein